MTRPDYAARAAAGGVFLDGQVASWPWDANLATLRMSDPYDCVLGQLGENYQDTLDDLHLSQDAAVELGFTLPAYEPWEAWAELDAAWAREIVTRREAAQVTT